MKEELLRAVLRIFDSTTQHFLEKTYWSLEKRMKKKLYCMKKKKKLFDYLTDHFQINQIKSNQIQIKSNQIPCLILHTVALDCRLISS